MPDKENDQLMCARKGCYGVQTFSENSRPPGWSSGTGEDHGGIHHAANEQPGWTCSNDPDHWDPPQSQE